MGVESIFLGLGIAFAQLVIGLALAMGSVYMGLRLFDKMTVGIDEMAELKKGNVAVAILLGAIIISIANVVQSGVLSLTTGLAIANQEAPMVIASLIIGTANLLVGLVLSIVSISIALSVLDKITTEIDEFKELKRGNVAVAITMAAVLIAVSFVISSAVAGMTNVLSAQSLASALGWA